MPSSTVRGDARMTTTEERPEVVVPTATVPSRNPLARRLPVALLVLGIALGFAIGGWVVSSSDSGSTSVAATGSGAGGAQLTKAIAAASAANVVDDRGYSKLENGVQHSHGFEQSLTPAERTELSRQMNLARETALQYPTLADAEAAGMKRAGPFSPGLGTHMIMYANYARGAGDGPMTDEQITHPLAWIYDGTKPDSPIAGLFYSSLSKTPQGFVGPNDQWHEHTNICIVSKPDGSVDAPLGADHDATKAQCDAVGGRLVTATGPLLHVWVVPGYEDSQGVYSHLNPAITCADGTYETIADVTQIGTRTSMCKDGVE
jgi:hypothetical protein